MISPNLSMAPTSLKLPIVTGPRNGPGLQIRPSLLASDNLSKSPSPTPADTTHTSKSGKSVVKMTNFSIAAIMNSNEQHKQVHHKNLGKIWNDSRFRNVQFRNAILTNCPFHIPDPKLIPKCFLNSSFENENYSSNSPPPTTR